MAVHWQTLASVINLGAGNAPFIRAMNALMSAYADHYWGEEDDPALEELDGRERIIAEAYLSYYRDYDETPSFPNDVSKWTGNGEGVYIGWDESADPDPLIRAIQATMLHHGLPKHEYVELEVGYGCSKLRPGEFGGFVTAIFPDEVIWSGEPFREAVKAEAEARRMAGLAHALNERDGFKPAEEE